MSEYIITKRVECDHDPATFVFIPYDNGTMAFTQTRGCPLCRLKGYTETSVDADEWLLSRLEKLRWDEACEQWGEYVSATKEMDNPRFEGDER